MDQNEVPSEMILLNEAVTSKKELHKCPKCDRTFANIGHMKCHFYRVHPEFRLASCVVPEVHSDLKIEISLKKQNKFESVIKHEDTKKSVASEPSIKNEKIYSPVTPIEEHEQICPVKIESPQPIDINTIKESLFKCVTCSKCFAKETSLFKHCLSVHPDVKPYPCSECEKSFHVESLLKAHLKFHSGKASKKVSKASNGCNFTFKRPEKKKKKFICEICNSSFQTKSSFIHHQDAHTKEKKFKCDVCNKEFANQSTLSRHSISHSDEKSYQCKECEMQFSDRASLGTHRLTHTRGNLTNARSAKRVLPVKTS